MISISDKPARTQWDVHRERPFLRLVELFVARIFRGGGDADAAGMDLGVGLVLTLLAMPGGFISILLFDKYGTFLQWLRGMTNVDPLQISSPDEYFFIVLSMTVTGAAAVWRWDAIFPDRRDYMNLVHLPISTRTIFLANLSAISFLAVLVSIDVNAASCVLFPVVVGATQSTFMFFFRFAIVHALGVLLASIFSFLAVFSVLGITMALLPPRAFKRISAYVRGVVVVYLITILCTAFAVPPSLRRLPNRPPSWTLLLPSSWFLSLCQVLRHRASPALSGLSRLVFPAIAVVALVAFVAYAISYRRHFVRIAEISEAAQDDHSAQMPWLYSWLDRLILRSPFERAGFRFVWKTLFRSEAHRLVLTGVAGLGIVLASQALMDAVNLGKPARATALSPEAISIPFVLSFLIIIGVRSVFEIPVELPSNWIFRLMLNTETGACSALARKIILTAVFPWIVLGLFPIYLYFAGWSTAILHTLVVVLWSVLLTDVVLVRFRKLPFTCTLPVFKQHSIVVLLAGCFGFLLYAVSLPEFESWALADPVRFLGLLPAILAVWYVPRRLTKTTVEHEKKLIFEETAPITLEVLQLSD